MTPHTGSFTSKTRQKLIHPYFLKVVKWEIPSRQARKKEEADENDNRTRIKKQTGLAQR